MVLPGTSASLNASHSGSFLLLMTRQLSTLMPLATMVGDNGSWKRGGSPISGTCARSVDSRSSFVCLDLTMKAISSSLAMTKL